MANAMEAVRQGVQQKAPDELIGRKRHEFGLAVMAIILPAEDDFGIGQADQAGVGDGDAVCVSAEIGKHLSRSTKGRLGIDHPLDPAQLAQPAGEGGGFGECCKPAEEAEFSGRECGTQPVEEQAAEEPREDAHRQEEAGATGDPARPVEGWSAAWHDAMNMRMMAQVLPPGVEHCDEAGLGAEMLRIGGDRAHRLGRGAEQDCVNRRLFWKAISATGAGRVNTAWKY